MECDSASTGLSIQGTKSKVCTVCGGAILWRRRLAANWDAVQHCSASCRRISVARARAGFHPESEGRKQSGAGSSAEAA
jgi:hypothetical protein